MMARKVQENPSFKYHVGCKELKLTHICFADDLLVLSHGSISSIKVIKEALNELCKTFGLLPNMSKSTIFFGNMNNIEKQKIIEILPFRIGILPMKYLGVPLITKSLGINECKGLVEKVKAKINDWKNKYRSFAGRLQLIASVLSSMQVYWASVFLLP
ncbi:RNA-directed DNA polymerase, eukaryota, reverse transcriptase zinc-binding domain protein [Tanacetum coccineum]|uniref:RNA-directed DNA polymerase, eukaryota, reverse transcriptase zinc-binding domain protein n=1 Tax=Tanacetum coccineum TaxID=301880 RepID=A0ABQ4YLQ0_9ASTR